MLPHSRIIGDEISTIDKRRDALAPVQVTLVILLGVAFWFTAAMVVRFGSPAGFFGPTASVFAFTLGIPVCWLAVLFIKHVARLKAGQTVTGVAIGTMTATFCDGIALTWARDMFYGSDPTQVAFGAAWILWGVGLFLLFAYLNDGR